MLAGEDAGASIGQSMDPNETGEGSGGGADQVAMLVDNVSKGLGTIFEIKNQIPETADEDKQAMAGLIEGFQGLISKLAQGGGAPQEGAAPQQQSRAIPVQGGMQGVPLPQG